MSIRLLATYDGFPPQSILTLDSALETALIADGNASATLTGGVVAYRERQPVMIQPATKKRGSVSLIANRKATVPLTEGSALTITPTAGTTGTYQRYDAAGAAMGGLGAIGASVLMVGPFDGDQTVEIKCTTGSLVAKTADAVLGAMVVNSAADGMTTPGGTTVYFITNSTFANLPPAATNSGRIYRVTDLGNCLFESNGTRWRPVNGRALIGGMDAGFSTSGTTETIVFQKALPAGCLANFDRLVMRMSTTKSASVETATFNLRLGTTGTVADTAIQNFVIATNTMLSGGFLVDFKRVDATHVKKLGNGANNSAYSGQATSLPNPSVAVSSMDATTTYLTATITMSGSSEAFALIDLSLEILASMG